MHFIGGENAVTTISYILISLDVRTLLFEHSKHIIIGQCNMFIK